MHSYFEFTKGKRLQKYKQWRLSLCIYQRLLISEPIKYSRNTSNGEYTLSLKDGIISEPIKRSL